MKNTEIVVLAEEQRTRLRREVDNAFDMLLGAIAGTRMEPPVDGRCAAVSSGWHGTPACRCEREAGHAGHHKHSAWHWAENSGPFKAGDPRNEELLRKDLADAIARAEAAEARADAIDEKAKAYERDWHAAKTKFGEATSKLRDQLREATARAEKAEDRVASAYDMLKAHDNYGSADLSVCVREVLRVIIDKDQWIDKTEKGRDEARAKLAKLVAAVQGWCDAEHGSRAEHEAQYHMTETLAEVSKDVETPPERATDQELFIAYDAAYLVAGELTHRGADADEVMPEERAGILAVAALVRKERRPPNDFDMGLEVTGEDPAARAPSGAGGGL